MWCPDDTVLTMKLTRQKIQSIQEYIIDGPSVFLLESINVINRQSQIVSITGDNGCCHGAHHSKTSHLYCIYDVNVCHNLYIGYSCFQCKSSNWEIVWCMELTFLHIVSVNTVSSSQMQFCSLIFHYLRYYKNRIILRHLPKGMLIIKIK